MHMLHPVAQPGQQCIALSAAKGRDEVGGMGAPAVALELLEQLAVEVVQCVDLDQVGPDRRRQLQFFLLVHFAQRLQPEFLALSVEVGELRRRQCTHDEQHRIGSRGPGLNDLIRIDQKVFAQQRRAAFQAGNLAQVCQVALEVLLVGQDGNGVGAVAGNVVGAVVGVTEGAASAAKKATREAREGVIAQYIAPGGRAGVLVEVNCETDFVARTNDFKDLAHNLALQIAATKPVYIAPEDVPADVIEEKKKTFTEAALAERKPANIVEKIVTGKIDAFLKEACLLRQVYIRDDKLTVQDLVQATIAKVGENIVVVDSKGVIHDQREDVLAGRIDGELLDAASGFIDLEVALPAIGPPGAEIINDISGFRSAKMLEVAARSGAAIVIAPVIEHRRRHVVPAAAEVSVSVLSRRTPSISTASAESRSPAVSTTWIGRPSTEMRSRSTSRVVSIFGRSAMLQTNTVTLQMSANVAPLTKPSERTASSNAEETTKPCGVPLSRRPRGVPPSRSSA